MVRDSHCCAQGKFLQVKLPGARSQREEDYCLQRFHLNKMLLTLGKNVQLTCYSAKVGTRLRSIRKFYTLT